MIKIVKSGNWYCCKNSWKFWPYFFREFFRDFFSLKNNVFDRQTFFPRPVQLCLVGVQLSAFQSFYQSFVNDFDISLTEIRKQVDSASDSSL